MLIYLLLIVAILFLGFILSKKRKTVYVTMICILMSLISGFRHYTIGNDTPAYLRTHNVVINEGFGAFNKSRLEPGYIMLNNISASITDDFNFFLLLMALITNIAIGIFITRHSKNPVLSLLLFILFRFFFNEMNIMRQFLSISLILYGVDYIKKRKILKYLMVVLLASTIHYSALFALPIYFLYRKHIGPRTKLMLSIVAIVAFFLLDKVLSILTARIGLYGGYVEEYIDSNKIGSILAAAMSAFMYFYCLMVYKKYKSEDTNESEYGFILNASLICMLLSICSIRISILSRLIDYYDIFVIISLPNINCLIKSAKKRMLANIAIAIIGFAYFFSVTLLRPDWNKVVPYKTYWS